MQYLSTRGGPAVTGAAAILQGIAPDGGLYLPERFPAYYPDDLAERDYRRLAQDIFALYLPEYADAYLEHICQAAYGEQFPPAVAPLKQVGDLQVLELWHGPTSAFKDMALQALPHLLHTAVTITGQAEDLVILVATSGDTGKAALEGFKDVPGVRIVAFYPQQGVSAIQAQQMLTTTGNNTFVVGVQGNFDDCQTAVKQIFADPAWAERLAAHHLRFSSANSINWGRLLPQIVYYYYAYGQMLKRGQLSDQEQVNIAVPTGNFGNILAAYYASRMGLPVHKLICASNENHILSDVINHGRYDRRRAFYQTTSPSMDILVSSNFERLIFTMLDQDAAATAALFQQLRREGFFELPPRVLAKWRGFLYGGFAEEKEVFATIREVYHSYGYTLDPHTAVGYAVAQQYREDHNDSRPIILASTASPFKFPQAVLEALGMDTAGLDDSRLLALLAQKSGWPLPAPLAGLDQLPVRHQRNCAVADLPAQLAEILGL